MAGHALIRDNDTGVVSTSDGIVVGTVPDASGVTDGFVLTAESGVPIWLPAAAVTGVNGITGGVHLVAGANVAITDGVPTLQDITIEASGSVGDGWEDDSAETWTYLSATSFTVVGGGPGELADKYTIGTRIKLAYGDGPETFHYFVVVDSEFFIDGESFDTVTTVFLAGEYTDLLSDASPIVENHHSYTSVAEGYPGWFRAHITDTYGFSGGSGGVALFHVVGRICTLIPNVGGESNAHTFGFTLPPGCPVPANEVEAIGLVTDGGVTKLGIGESQVGLDGTVIAMSVLVAGPPDYSVQPDATGWANAGRKDTGALIIEFELAGTPGTS